ncbi:MAG: endopeptidase La [SAR324 cluster bacterium]|nr:endopeptidase La [SAR324 cluster bacterium]
MGNEKSIVIAADIFPDVLPIFPIFDRPLFPKMMVPIIVAENDAKKIVRKALEASPSYLGLVLAKSQPNVRSLQRKEDLHTIGVVGKIVQIRESEPDQPVPIMLQLLERFEILDLMGKPPVFLAKVEYWHTVEMTANEELKAYSISIIDCIKEMMQMKPLVQEELQLLMSRLDINDPGTLADFAAFTASTSGEELQKILETKSIRARIEEALILLKKELEISKLQVQINKRIEERLTTQQREFFLKEQLKEIKKELGLTKDDTDTEVEKFKKRIKLLKLTPEAKTRVDEELEKLRLIPPSSPEFNVTRAYLDWLTILPWGKYSNDKYDLARASKILDQDHHGLNDVKERILEFISVGKIKGNLSGSIILLVGPPGVGKTSIGQSIAKSLGRRFFRFSLGGMRDEAEIKGHRRTYIGALPGKFINAIKTTKTSNPVIMLDEIDKIGASFVGDPASSLLEVLDPEQNQDFLDHYLDVRFDLSKVLFICTANQLETIPGPLLDRMEVIRLSGYILEDKVEIAKKHLIPKQLKKHGLTARKISLPDAVLHELIDGYAREAGVRGLENQIKKILRKSTKKIVESNLAKVSIQVEDLPEFLGRRVFQEEKLYQKPMVGVVKGLAYTSLGGATLYIEATKIVSNQPGYKQTGQLGNVMIESSEIAYTYVRSILGKKNKVRDFFAKHFIHLHVPAGATPKDGPSAGITMACALYSLALNKVMRNDIAMTGELSLNGRVMPIGGVKEKLLAAKRAKIANVIFPDENRMDFEELEDHIKEGITVHFAETFEQVRKICFPK